VATMILTLFSCKTPSREVFLTFWKVADPDITILIVTLDMKFEG